MRSIDGEVCAGTRHAIDGHLGWRWLLPGPRLRELYPDTCLNGHTGVRRTLGWAKDCRTITCTPCWDARLPNATAYYCTCRADLVSDDLTEIPPEVLPHVDSSDSPKSSAG